MTWLWVPWVDPEGLPYALEPEDSSWASQDFFEGTRPFVMWRGKPMPPRSLFRTWKKGGFIRLLFGLTCEPSILVHGLEKWILSQEDSPVNHSQKQDPEEGKKTPATFGPTSSESLGFFDPVSSSWKTSQVSLMTQEYQSLTTWPLSVMTSAGLALRLELSERLTVASGGSASRSIPTPTVADSSGFGPKKVFLEGLKQGNWRGARLRDYVIMYPTPTATANQLCPSMLSKGGAFNNYQANGGKLNPTWIEWLMGWPIGWSVCDFLETESYPSKQKQHTDS